MRYPLTLVALAFLLVALPARAGQPALLLGPDPAPGRTLLLALEAGPDGVTVRDASVASIRAKAPVAKAASQDDALLLALVDEAGEPLVIAEIVVPWTLYGPFLGEDGEMHCRGERQERVVFGAKLPLPAEAAGLVVLERGAAAPTDTADLVRALRATPADFGLVVRGRERLTDLPGLRGVSP